MSSFAQFNLDSQINKAITACGYTMPTPIQAQSIPEVLKGKDLVASAQTGTGKTAAFILPVLHRLTLKEAGGNPRVLILTPTRELAAQITQAATKYGKFLRFNIISLVGGMPYRQQIKDLSRSVDIVVATPGRLLDHLDNGRIDLSELEMLILDEADRMLDMGFIDDVKAIAKETPPHRQTLLFSATVDNRLTKVINQLLKNPLQINFAEEKIIPNKIIQELYIADNSQHKDRLLNHFLTNGNIWKAIIFSGTKFNADKLAKDLRDQGHAAAALHGDLKQAQRTRTISQLRSGKIQFLVATDVAARGIDIEDITDVINYDLPKFPEDYVHRIGRTGRAGKTGRAISFALSNDTRHVKRIAVYTGQSMPQKTIEGLEPTKNLENAPSNKNKRNNKRSFSSSRGYSSSDGPKRSYGGRSSSSNSDAPKRSYGGRDSNSNSDAPKRSYGSDRGYSSNSNAPKRSYGGRDSNSSSDAPKRSYGSDRGYSSNSDAPKRSYGGRDSNSSSDAPKRSYGGRDSNSSSDAPKRSYGGRDSNSSSDAPKRSYGGRDSNSSSDAPKRSYGSSRSSSSNSDAPKRSYGGRDSNSSSDAPKRSYGGRDSNSSSDAPKRSYGSSRSSSSNSDAPKRSYAKRDDKSGYGFSAANTNANKRFNNPKKEKHIQQ